MMTLDILICTIDEGIERVPEVLMPPRDGVRYVVSMQWTSPEKKELVPTVLKEREDVTLTLLEGRGLSRNRNHALECATGDIRLIADDDNRYTDELIDNLLEAYQEHAEADIICLTAESYDGQPMKTNPKEAMPYEEAFRLGYYPISIELSMREGVDVKFDERFGLGAERFCAGEEDVWMKDALDRGYKAMFVPKVVVRSYDDTTGAHLVGNAALQQTKGAVFRHLFGTPEAVWRTLKEAGWWMVHKGANPLPIAWNMLKGMRSLG